MISDVKIGKVFVNKHKNKPTSMSIKDTKERILFLINICMAAMCILEGKINTALTFPAFY